MTSVASMLVTALADLGVRTIWGVVGDALNPFTDAIRTEDRIEWIGVRHEEAGAFAAGAQAQLMGTLGVCAGTVGPGSVHLRNGLYDAKKSHAPVLAICGRVPTGEIGSDFFRVHPHRDQPGAAALPAGDGGERRTAAAGVGVLTLPGDIGDREVPGDTRFVDHHPATTASPTDLHKAATLIGEAGKVTMLVGIGARDPVRSCSRPPRRWLFPWC